MEESNLLLRSASLTSWQNLCKISGKKTHFKHRRYIPANIPYVYVPTITLDEHKSIYLESFFHYVYYWEPFFSLMYNLSCIIKVRMERAIDLQRNQKVSMLSTKIEKVWNLNGTRHRDGSTSRTPATSKMKSSLMLQGS